MQAEVQAGVDLDDENQNIIKGLGDIMEEDEPDESINGDTNKITPKKSPNNKINKSKSKSKSKSPKIKGKNGVSPKSKSPKSKSPKGKSPKGKTPKGKTPKGKSPKGKTQTNKEVKSKSPNNKEKGHNGRSPTSKSPKSKSPKAEEKLKIKLPKSPKTKETKSPKSNKKIKSPRNTKAQKDIMKEINGDETQTSRFITSSRDNNFRVTKTTLNSNNNIESEEDITINHKNDNSYPDLNDDEKYKNKEIKIK